MSISRPEAKILKEFIERKQYLSGANEFDRVERVLRQLGYSEGQGYSADHMIDGQFVSTLQIYRITY